MNEKKTADFKSAVAHIRKKNLMAKNPEHGHTSMTSQYIMPENIIRVMLWGNLQFMSTVMSVLGDLEKN